MEEHTSFPYKTAISQANVKKTNRMISTKWTYRKERSFASNQFIFLKILFPLTQMRVLFFIRASALFSVRVSLKQIRCDITVNVDSLK